MTPCLFDSGKDSIAALAALHHGAFTPAWSETAIADLLASPGTFAFHLPEGFILVRAAGDEAEILTLAVAVPARGQGLGRALLRAAADHAAGLGAKTLFLEVSVNNPPALALYGGQGFVRAGQRKAYYGAGSGQAAQDALILKAELPLSRTPDFA